MCNMFSMSWVYHLAAAAAAAADAWCSFFTVWSVGVFVGYMLQAKQLFLQTAWTDNLPTPVSMDTSDCLVRPSIDWLAWQAMHLLTNFCWPTWGADL